MKKFRAVRFPNHFSWKIEEWDSEFQVASIHFITFESKERAEQYIRVNLIAKDIGENGEWIDGSIS